MENVDAETVAGFGDEWTRFSQDGLSAGERRAIFESYFSMLDLDALPRDSVGADFGCGSGRWAALVAPRVGRLHLVDASDAALRVARANLATADNVELHRASVSEAPFPDASLDFAYSLGVLHHVPDTEGALGAIARKLKRGAPFVVYLYYAFDQRPRWFRGLWRASDVARRAISRLPHGARYAASQALAAGVYWPLARGAAVLDRLGVLPPSWPLAYYRDRSFYVMRTDALDRFGTRLEKRFTRLEIAAMLARAGFEGVRFSDREPYWVAIATRA
jgi:ubiquinone/menaquinone biosynthesis C-methylase UbiE